MMKYKVGDKVKVRSDLKINTIYGKHSTITKMVDFRDRVVTISEVYPTFYCIEEDEENLAWTDEMFEGFAKDELTAEEAIRLFGELCSNFDCSVCPINNIGIGCGEENCNILQAEHPGEVVEALKQWKKTMKKK